MVEARTVTGPMKPLLLAAGAERDAPAAQSPRHVRVAVTTTRDPLLGVRHSNEFLDAAHAAGVRTRLCLERRLLDFQVVRQLRAVLEEERPDIIETHDFKSHLLFWLARRKLPRLRQPRWIAFHHGYTRMSAKVRAYQQLDRLTLRDADAVVTLCKPFVPVLAARGVDRDRIHVVTNCIESKPATGTPELEALRTRLGLQDERILLCVGRLSPEKGHSDLFVALDGMPVDSGQPRWKLLIVGDGGENARLRKEAARFGERVQFLGHQSDPWPYYQLADVFVLPSHSEGSPLVVLEAMAARLAIVATSVGGVPEVIEAEKDGLLVPPANPEALRAALLRMLGDEDLRICLGRAAELSVQAHSPVRYTERLHAVYDLVCRSAPRAAA